ncbi:MAG: ATP-binding cassette domain-containing protein [Melioribacteraceae bacterium]|nr:ATP-binding cassette domain-containing protein [Melioribacteraceae bacterium]MCF8353917.1 ATP-binding cassette domain-containing protein [Melioribacteraceae bacterium]MCF8392674.1 ATP-binding cassette domain-containing protein [Melioribacteraceae bacterium]MCF8417695.1 ATP-binding cassette domain-containing protein [Melioribacteraceae bacterium]
MIIKGLNFSYDEKPLYEDFCFESESKIIALKGPSGCGKTTLLKILSKNLIPQKYSEIDFRTNTFLVIQEDGLFPWLSGEQNILHFIDIDYKSITENEIFENIKTYWKKKAFEMSFGQRRMIELFRAILLQPDLLLLDEPFNFLDKKNRKIITKTLLEISKRNTEIIFTSHYKEENLSYDINTYYYNGSFPIRRLENEKQN